MPAMTTYPPGSRPDLVLLDLIVIAAVCRYRWESYEKAVHGIGGFLAQLWVVTR
jgi:hypothetical protein